MRQLVYTMFISNDRPSCHLRWNENLVNHLKVSKYYETDCPQIFLLLIMLLLTNKVVKSSHISTRIFFIFLNNVLKQTWNSFNTKFQPRWKDRESINQVRQILELFCHFIANFRLLQCEGLRVTKIFKEIKFEGVWGKLGSRKCFQGEMAHSGKALISGF